MTAQTVTGKGLGDAHPGIKGPGNGRNVYVPLQSAHVVASGRNALVAGALTYTFSTPLAGSHTNYVVMITSETANAARVSAKTDSGSNFVSFGAAGTGSDVFGWAIVKTGVA